MAGDEGVKAQVRKRVARELSRELGDRGLGTALKRVRSMLDIWVHGLRPTGQRFQHMIGLCIPDLPTSPWLDPRRFEFHRQATEAFECILDEYQGFSASGEALAPYPPARPLPGWRALHLCQRDRRRPHLARDFPRAAVLLEHVRKANRYVQQLAFFLLEPRAALPRHADAFNYLVSVHLGISCPPGSGLEVGRQVRPIHDGELVAFDNSFEHTAWNHHPTQPRVILAMHVLHPALTPPEMEAIRMLHPVLSRYVA